MPATYEPIATTTFSSSATSYTFSSIPSTYTDLVLVANVINTAFEVISVQFNGDTGTNYSWTTLQGDGSSISGDRNTGAGSLNIGLRRSGVALNHFHIMNYTNTTTYKPVLSVSSAYTNRMRLIVGQWKSTSAINSIKISAGDAFTSGSMFTLYGILAA